MVEKGIQSSTVKSYVSGIKSVLPDDGYEWKDDLVLLNTLTRACKLVNDHIRTRLPIQAGLLDLLLFELQRFFKGEQYYLEIMYKASFLTAYYGLMRIGELCHSNHALRAANLHLGENKEKILMVLYSSKTHGKESAPQKIKITSVNQERKVKNNRNFCPFKLYINTLQ